MEALKIKHLEKSITPEAFINELVRAKHKSLVPEPTPGHLWEHEVGCNHCGFSKQCADICEAINQRRKLNCRDVVDFLLGVKSLEDISY